MTVYVAMKPDIDFIVDVVAHRIPEAGISCIMVGGHAVNHYGVTRATQDIDFMIAVSAAETVRIIMKNAGFTNIAVHETVMFFNHPGSPLRVDFLKVDQDTMRNLLANAVCASYAGTNNVLVPRLHDLLAMKLFALTTGGPKRKDKDFPDIVNLVIENQVDVETDLKALCIEFGSESVYEAVRARVKELKHA